LSVEAVQDSVMLVVVLVPTVKIGTLGAVVSVPEQVVPLQAPPEMQSPLLAQLVLHAVGPQMYGVQLVVVAGQVPDPVQLAAAVWTPALQLAERHGVVLDG
jgi:hypothetical protein